MGLFSKERVVTVGGGVSRVREDSLIRDTIGLVVSGAVTSNSDLGEAIRLHSMTGTVSSYKYFNRRCKKFSEIGLPTTKLQSSIVDKDALSLAIRTDTGNAYPLSTDIVDTDVYMAKLTVLNHFQFAFQSENNYNLTTGLFAYLGRNYIYDSYTELNAAADGSNTGYTVEGHANLTTDTTVTATYTTSPGDVGFVNVYQTVVTVITYTYDPPYSIPNGGGTVYNSYVEPDTADLSGYAYNTFSSVNSVENVSFDLEIAKPAWEISTSTYDGGTVITPVYHWTVFYTYSGRYYIWVKAFDTQIFLDTDTEFPETAENTFAPIVPIQDNKKVYSPTYEPTKYEQAKKALKIIQLDPDLITDELPTDQGIEDVYVSIFSNLVSEHTDQLAYNFAFFDYLRGPSIVTLMEYLPGTNLYSHNSLITSFKGIFKQELNYAYIAKTVDIVGTLSSDYEYEFLDVLDPVTEEGMINWILSSRVRDYKVKKKTGANSYDEILVKNLSISYIVYSSGGDHNLFSPNIDPNDQNGTQLIIPVSYKIAEDALSAKELEFFFLRSTHVGMFNKVVTYIKWYQQEWFQVVLIVATLAYAVWSGDLQTLMTVLESEAALLHVTLYISFELALVLVIAKYAVIQFVLKAVLTKVLGSTSGVLRDLLAIAYVVYSIYSMGGLSGKGLLGGLNAYSDVEAINLQSDVARFQSEYETLMNIQKDLEPVLKEIKEEEFKQIWGDYVLTVFNFFRKPSDGLLTESQLELQSMSVNALITQITNHVELALRKDPATLIIESNRLIETV